MAELTFAETALRTALAAGPAVLIGLERELEGERAGLRTHLLLALGACLFTLAGLHLGLNDASRVAAQVVTGVGFIGAGAILRGSFRVEGLSTAASLWVTAAVGVAAALGAYLALASVVVVSLLVLIAVPVIQKRVLPRRRRQRLILTLEPDRPLEQVAEQVRAAVPHFRVIEVKVVDDGSCVLVGEAPRPRGQDPLDVLAEVRTLPGIRAANLLV